MPALLLLLGCVGLLDCYYITGHGGEAAYPGYHVQQDGDGLFHIDIDIDINTQSEPEPESEPIYR